MKGFSKIFSFLFFFVAIQAVMTFTSLPLEAHSHWHNHEVVVVDHPWYHKDHVVVYNGDAYPKYYGGRPYYYYSPQYYYSPEPVIVAPAPVAAVNVNIGL